MPKHLVVIVGATAVGKTELSLRLAQHFSTEIVSADSRQLYKEMSIGTGKPTLGQMKGIPHYFINSHSIHDPFTVADFEKEALEVIDKIFQTKDIALLVGGSGMYVKVLCEGLDDIPEVESKYRWQLQERLSQEGLGPLVEELRALDPLYYEIVDRANPQRIIRALEVCHAIGKPFSEFHKKKKTVRPFQTIKIGLLRSRQELHMRIERRVDHMLAEGLLEEAKMLCNYKNHNALQTVGYQEIFDYLQGDHDWNEAIRLIKRNTRRYAKRQETWFRKDKEIEWFHPNEWKGILHYIHTKIS